MVARVIVERPMALGAGFQARPGPILLRRKHDREHPTNCVVQPVHFGGEQLQPTRLVGPDAQARGGRSVIKRLGALRGEGEFCIG